MLDAAHDDGRRSVDRASLDARDLSARAARRRRVIIGGGGGRGVAHHVAQRLPDAVGAAAAERRHRAAVLRVPPDAAQRARCSRNEHDAAVPQSETNE